jgi:hypothetical protein
MRGWEWVGQVEFDGYVSIHENVHDDDIIAFSPSGVSLRQEFWRVRDVRGRFTSTFTTLAADKDIIFRATALGESAFARPQ